MIPGKTTSTSGLRFRNRVWEFHIQVQFLLTIKQVFSNVGWVFEAFFNAFL
jgi:hypothetical protein